jgi:hypothetical protein
MAVIGRHMGMIHMEIRAIEMFLMYVLVSNTAYFNNSR